jgi:hypothetical protein
VVDITFTLDDDATAPGDAGALDLGDGAGQRVGSPSGPGLGPNCGPLRYGTWPLPPRAAGHRTVHYRTSYRSSGTHILAYTFATTGTCWDPYATTAQGTERIVVAA